MNKTINKIFALCIALLAFQSHATGDPALGMKLANGTCAACHGGKGISIASMYPNLAGQKGDYLVSQLKAYKSGARSNPIMAPMAKNLSDQDMDNVAAYYSAIK